ncbi:DUF3489 domain-containing protein [Frigidibacter mobilis]|uniref:DUF3489 domain-containing protein n=1 Tax=Frigidibacter mobilis TaxID=1335048 RepID=A0A159Z7B5_9RHOB|nr:DUF3489 domain-containing protein [Frigidibacter mobilis]AMY71312.1 hypothetical protein AKL17_4090 [Frigidibacter mobilis]
MTNLTETQSIILAAGAKRPANIALPLPKGLAGAAAKMTVTRMIDQGLLHEVDADPRCGEPLWRETGDGRGTTLMVTEAGLLAIGIEPVVVQTMVAVRRRQVETPAQKQPAQRAGTKQAILIAMLQKPEGATIAELAAATGWQAHTVRGAMSGVLKKKLGLPISAKKVEGSGTVYKLPG